MEEENAGEEAITVEFDDGLLLHVPLQESHLLSRYVSDEQTQTLQIGVNPAKTRRQQSSPLCDLAADLLRLQASEKAIQGTPFHPMISGKKNLRMLSLYGNSRSAEGN